MSRYDELKSQFTEHLKVSDAFVERGTQTVLELMAQFVIYLEAPVVSTHMAPVGSDFNTMPGHRFNSVTLLEDGWFGAMLFIKDLHPMAGSLGFTFYARLLRGGGATAKTKRGQEHNVADLKMQTLTPFFANEFHSVIEFLQTPPETLVAGGEKRPIGFIWEKHTPASLSNPQSAP